MEERKLNFNKPLLSVRQPLTNRRHKLAPYSPYTNMEQVTEPVAVPFMWEQIPGQPKEDEAVSASPRLREFEHKTERKQINFDDDMKRIETSGVSLDEFRRDANLVEDDPDDAYSDAVDTLSSTGSVSYSFNCSVSNLSGSSGWVPNSSRTFLVDPKTRDFMMNRFLPAARAVALGPHQVQSAAPQKAQLAIVPFEPPKSVKPDSVGAGNNSRRVPSKLYSANIMQHYQQEDVSKEETEDEADSEYDFGNADAKGCGLLPRLCLLNPVPGMKIRAPSPTSFTSMAKKLSREASTRSVSQPKNMRSVDSDQKVDREALTPKIHRMENNRLFCVSNRFRYSGELRTPGGLSPYRQSWSNDASTPKTSNRFNFSGELRTRGGFSPVRPSRNNDIPTLQASSRFNFSGELRTRSGLSPFRQPRNNEISDQQPSSEKTLHVDTRSTRNNNVPALQTSSRFSYSGELRTRGGLSPFRQPRNNDLSVRPAPSEKTLYVDSLKIAQNSYANSNSSNHETWMKLLTVADVKKSADNESSCQDIQCMNDLKESVTADGDYSNSNTNQNPKEEDGESAVVVTGSLEPPPLPLPSLKSPSESWLWRALPSVASKNSFFSKKQNPKSSFHDTKWENIVKSSHLRHDHVRYSEELITHVSKQLKP